ncbi:MAG: transcriptional regulator NrdR [Candidatus Melainabacteria bacterium]|nr:transcriptional regulator NrdR [Candidatus Melainabacteria bacterium]
MFCPFCNKKDSRVLESRLTGENSVRRRRECEACAKRFTTYERLEVMQVLVVKRSGSREPYTREKLMAGVRRACAKTMVTAEQIDDLVDSVENELAMLGKKEVPASLLGELSLGRLKELDEVAYVRFASVYRQFRSIEDFVSELNTLKDTQTLLENAEATVTSVTTDG